MDYKLKIYTTIMAYFWSKINLAFQKEKEKEKKS